MIRYVLAVLLSISILSIGMTALDSGRTVASDRQVENQLRVIETEAAKLLDGEGTPPVGRPGPTRTVELTLPEEGIYRDGIDRLVFERVPGTNHTAVTYRIDGATHHRTLLDVPLVDNNRSVLELNGRGGTIRMELELRATTDGSRIIIVSVL